MIKPCCLLLLLVITITGYSQINQQYIFNHLGSKDGLLSEETNATAQDSKGFIWIAGKNGLQRFDGYRFENFRHVPGDSNTIPHNYITNLTIDKANRLWLTSVDFRLGYFDVDKFIFHPVAVLFNNKFIEDINADLKLDLNSNILLVLHNPADNAYGVLTYDEKRQLFLRSGDPFNLPENWNIQSFSIDDVTGNIWFGTSEGLIKFNPSTHNYSYRDHNADDDPVIKALQNYRTVENPLMDKQGNFWMNLMNIDRKNMHLLKYDGSTKKVYDFSSEINIKLKNTFSKINSITQYGKGPVWITGRNIFILAFSQLDFILSDLPGRFSIHYDEIRGQNIDRENNTWISTNNGLYRTNLSRSLFRYVDNKKFGSANIKTSDVVDFIDLPTGNILVASWGNGLFEYDRNFNPVKSEIASQGDEKGEKLTWSATMTNNGDIWTTQQEGYLYVYHAQAHTTEVIHNNIFEGKTIRQVVKDKNGNLWFGGQNGVVVKWTQKTNNFKLITKMKGPVFRLYTDHSGDVWALAESVVKFDIDNDSIIRRLEIGPSDGRHLFRGDIIDIVQYNDSSYIIATLGLNIVNAKTGHVEYYTTENGLPSDYISNLIFDKKGNLWVSTENGICKINFTKNIRAVYGLEDGIYNYNVTPCSSMLLSDGRILLGTNHNVIVFDPDKIGNDGPSQPSPIITGLSVMNTDLPLDSIQQLKEIQISYRSNSIIIRYSTLTFGAKQDLVYRMKTVDKTWINSEGRNEAIYPYLPSGKYTFTVGVKDPTGAIINTTSLNFNISTPFWKSWLFYLTIALLTGAVIWWLYRERIKRIKGILQMRNNIGQELHKEVSTTLKNISVLSEIAALKADVDLEQSKDYIQEIKIKSRSTVTAMDDVMWSIDPSNDSMIKMIDRIYETIDILGSEYNTKIDLRVDDKVMSYMLSMKERLDLMIIYKMAILIMVKDMLMANVEVTIKKDYGNLLIRITGKEANNIDELNIQKKISDINSRAISEKCKLDIDLDKNNLEVNLLIKR